MTGLADGSGLGGTAGGAGVGGDAIGLTFGIGGGDTFVPIVLSHAFGHVVAAGGIVPVMGIVLAPIGGEAVGDGFDEAAGEGQILTGHGCGDILGPAGEGVAAAACIGLGGSGQGDAVAEGDGQNIAILLVVHHQRDLELFHIAADTGVTGCVVMGSFVHNQATGTAAVVNIGAVLESIAVVGMNRHCAGQFFQRGRDQRFGEIGVTATAVIVCIHGGAQLILFMDSILGGNQIAVVVAGVVAALGGNDVGCIIGRSQSFLIDGVCLHFVGSYQDDTAVCGDGDGVGEGFAGNQIDPGAFIGDGLGCSGAVCQNNNGVGIVRTDKAHHISVAGGERFHAAGTQGRILSADGSQLCIPFHNILVALAPGECAAVIGIVAANHADFVTIVNGGSAGVGELQEGNHILQLLGTGRGLFVGGESTVHVLLVTVIFQIVQIAEYSGGIVGCHQVHHGIECFLGVTFPEDLQDGHGFVSGQIVIILFSLVVPVDQVASCEAGNCITEHVVHDGVVHITLQVIGSIGPDFANDNSFAVQSLDGVAEIAPGLVGDFVGNVQTPAVHTLGNPVGIDGVFAIDDLLGPVTGLVLGAVGGVDDGHGIVAPPAFVGVDGLACAQTDMIHGSHGGRGNGKPLGVRVVGDAVFAGEEVPGGSFCHSLGDTLLAHVVIDICPVGICADLAVVLFGSIGQELVVTVEIHRVIGDMVEHAVQDDVHAVFFCHSNQFLKIAQSTQDGVDFGVADCIVAVVGDGPEDGVQVNHVDTQSLQVTNLFGDALQVTAVDFVGPVAVTLESVGGVAGLACHFGVLGQQIPVGHVFVVHFAAGPGLDLVVGNVCIEETVGEDLINDSILHPVGSLEAGFIDHQIVCEDVIGVTDTAGTVVTGLVVVVPGIVAVEYHIAAVGDGEIVLILADVLEGGGASPALNAVDCIAVLFHLHGAQTSDDQSCAVGIGAGGDGEGYFFAGGNCTEGILIFQILGVEEDVCGIHLLVGAVVVGKTAGRIVVEGNVLGGGEGEGIECNGFIAVGDHQIAVSTGRQVDNHGVGAIQLGVSELGAGGNAGAGEGDVCVDVIAQGVDNAVGDVAVPEGYILLRGNIDGHVVTGQNAVCAIVFIPDAVDGDLVFVSAGVNIFKGDGVQTADSIIGHLVACGIPVVVADGTGQMDGTAVVHPSVGLADGCTGGIDPQFDVAGQLACGEVIGLLAVVIVVEDEVQGAACFHFDGGIVPAGVAGSGSCGAGPIAHGMLIHFGPGIGVNGVAPIIALLEVDGGTEVGPLAGSLGVDVVVHDPQFGRTGDGAGGQIRGLMGAVVENEVEGLWIRGADGNVIPAGLFTAGGNGLAGPGAIVFITGELAGSTNPEIGVDGAAPALGFQVVQGNGVVTLGNLRRIDDLHIAQGQGAVGVDGQGEGQFRVAGNEHLLSCAGLEGGSGVGAVDFGPVLIAVAVLDHNIGIRSEGGGEGAVLELVAAQVGGITCDAEIRTVDPACQIVVYSSGLFFHNVGEAQSQSAVSVVNQNQFVLTGRNVHFVAVIAKGSAQNSLAGVKAQPSVGLVNHTVGIRNIQVAVGSDGDAQLAVFKRIPLIVDIRIVDRAGEVVGHFGGCVRGRRAFLVRIFDFLDLVAVVPEHLECQTVFQGGDVGSLISVAGIVILITVDDQAGCVGRNFDGVNVIGTVIFHLGHGSAGPGNIGHVAEPVIGTDITPEPVIAEVNGVGGLYFHTRCGDDDVTGDQFAGDGQLTALTVIAVAGDGGAAYGDGHRLGQGMIRCRGEGGGVCSALFQGLRGVGGGHIGQVIADRIVDLCFDACRGDGNFAGDQAGRDGQLAGFTVIAVTGDGGAANGDSDSFGQNITFRRGEGDSVFRLFLHGAGSAGGSDVGQIVADGVGSCMVRPAAGTIVPGTCGNAVAVVAVGGNRQIVGLVPFVVPIVCAVAGVHAAENHIGVSCGDGTFVVAIAVGIRHALPAAVAVVPIVNGKACAVFFPIIIGFQVQLGSISSMRVGCWWQKSQHHGQSQDETQQPFCLFVHFHSFLSDCNRGCRKTPIYYYPL